MAVDVDSIRIGMTERPEVRGPERLQPLGRGLRNFTSGVDLVVQHHEHPEPPRRLASRDPQGVHDVEEGVRAEAGRGALCAPVTTTGRSTLRVSPRK